MTGKKIINIELLQAYDELTQVVVQRDVRGIKLMGKMGDVEGFRLVHCFDCPASRDLENEGVDELLKPDQEDTAFRCRPRKGIRNCDEI